MLIQLLKDFFKPFNGPSLRGPTKFKYSEGMIGRLVYLDGEGGCYPYFTQGRALGLVDGEKITIRPSKCLIGLIRPALNYQLLKNGKWHRVEVIVG